MVFGNDASPVSRPVAGNVEAVDGDVRFTCDEAVTQSRNGHRVLTRRDRGVDLISLDGVFGIGVRSAHEIWVIIKRVRRIRRGGHAAREAERRATYAVQIGRA